MQEVNSSFNPDGCSSQLRSALQGKDGNSPLVRVLTERMGNKSCLLILSCIILLFYVSFLPSCSSALDNGFLSPGSEH